MLYMEVDSDSDHTWIIGSSDESSEISLSSDDEDIADYLVVYGSDADYDDDHVDDDDDNDADADSTDEQDERNNLDVEDISDHEVQPEADGGDDSTPEQNERNSPTLRSPGEAHPIPPILDLPESNLDMEASENKICKEAKLSSPKASLDKSVDDDGQICPICFEPWTNSSDHRLVSLKCGHLYGQSCIYKWLKGHKPKCPQCNTSAKRSDVRKIYARTLKVLDTSERDHALEKLEKESELRCKLQMEYSQMKLKYQMSTQECESLKKELMETKNMMCELRSNCRTSEKFSQSRQPRSEFVLDKNIELSKQGGCRVFDVCDFLGMFVISQPSTNHLFRGYGLKKVSTLDFRPSEFMYVHQKPIKDVAFHKHDGLVLTASLDKTVKLTSILSNSVVQSFSLENDVWSCTWNKDDLRYFYAGVRNGTVLLFDMRKTNHYVCQLPSMGYTSPVVALEYLPKPQSSCHSKSGLLVGHLSSCSFYEMLDSDASYAGHPLPLTGSFTSLSCEEETGHFLASCRPSAKHTQVTHALCTLSFDESSPVPCLCDRIQTMCGGKTQVQLAKSKVFPHPDDDSSMLVCSGDEDAQGALLWNGCTGEHLYTLKADSPVLDSTTFKINHQQMLATLTEKNLRFYSWSTS